MSCQNSIADGTTRNPDQFAGRGTVSPGYRTSSSATRRSSSPRLANGRDCSEACAPIREIRARLMKYASASAPLTPSTAPSTRTCRRKLFQWNSSAACGLPANSTPFRPSVFV